MPPEVRADVMASLGVWPLPQSDRDAVVDMVAKKMSGVLGTFTLRHGTIPEPEASRAAATLEAEAYAAASAYAAGSKVLATEEERFEVVRIYTKDLWSRAYSYAKSRRPQAAIAAAGGGTSSSRAAGPAALLLPSQGQCSNWGCRRRPATPEEGPYT
ncbi:unnamed protein product [Urochloa humidicola]